MALDQDPEILRKRSSSKSNSLSLAQIDISGGPGPNQATLWLQTKTGENISFVITVKSQSQRNNKGFAKAPTPRW